MEEAQVDGAPAEHNKHCKEPKIEESALKYTALTFSKIINSKNKRDVVQQLKEVVRTMRFFIVGQTWANVETVKWYLSLNKNFRKTTCPGLKTGPAVTSCLEVFKSTNIHEHDYQLDVGYNQIVLEINEF